MNNTKNLDPKFIQIHTSDGLTLPALLFEAKNSSRVGIFIHGSGSSSVFKYDNYFLAENLLKNNISLLMFDNRGAHLINKLLAKTNGQEMKKLFGSAYEIIKECVADIDAAIQFVKNIGYSEIILIGGSSGANKICVYNHYKKNNEVNKFVLLSAGDDIGFYKNILGEEKFESILNKSQEMIKKGLGDNLIIEILPKFFLSFKSYNDMLSNKGDYNVFPFHEYTNKKTASDKSFSYFKELSKPTLVVYPENDEFVGIGTEKGIEILKEIHSDFDYYIVENVSHNFSDGMNEASRVISEWIIK